MTAPSSAPTLRPGLGSRLAKSLREAVLNDLPARTAVLVLAAMILASSIALALTARPPGVASGDAPSYLDGAYHLARFNTLNEAQTSADASPAIAREPGYGFFLSVLMRLDPRLRQFKPECLAGTMACDVGLYRWIPRANLILIQLTGIVVFLLALCTCRNALAALVAAAYILFNFAANKFWWDPMSDRLAVFLLSLSMLALAWAWPSRKPLRWGATGLCFAALTLTKAVFFYFCLLTGFLALVYAAFATRDRTRIVQAVAVAFIAYGLAVGPWTLRNNHVSGEFRLTDARSGIALSTREVFDRMTPAQYWASFVYWTKGPGPGLARRLFPADVVAPFDLDAPGGFYDEGQNGYVKRATAITVAQGVGWLEATRILDRQILGSIAAHPTA